MVKELYDPHMFNYMWESLDQDRFVVGTYYIEDNKPEWDFIDHLNNDEVGRLVHLCHSLLKPRGMMMITSFEKQWAPSQTHSFVIRDGYQITFRLQDHLNLPRYYHSNRIITDMLSKFSTVKSFIYRNGVREFLCRRD